MKTKNTSAQSSAGTKELSGNTDETVQVGSSEKPEMYLSKQFVSWLQVKTTFGL